jgi:hypothetical protein
MRRPAGGGTSPGRAAGRPPPAACTGRLAARSGISTAASPVSFTPVARDLRGARYSAGVTLWGFTEAR